MGLRLQKAKSGRRGCGVTGAFPKFVWAVVPAGSLLGLQASKPYRTPMKGCSVAEVAVGGSVHQEGGHLIQGRWFTAQLLEPSANKERGGEWPSSFVHGDLTDGRLSLSIDPPRLLLPSLTLASA